MKSFMITFLEQNAKTIFLFMELRAPSLILSVSIFLNLRNLILNLLMNLLIINKIISPHNCILPSIISDSITANAVYFN